MNDTIRHVTISGRVQGVGYRYWVEQKARALGLEVPNSLQLLADEVIE